MLKRLTRSRVARLTLALVAVASLATGTLTVAQPDRADAWAVMGWPEWYPPGTGQRCVIGLEVGDYYGHPYAITRDLGYGGGSGWCSGNDPYLGNWYRYRVEMSFWLPGCGYNAVQCLVTYVGPWISGYQYQGVDTYTHVGGSYVAEPERACIAPQHWVQGVGWSYDNPYPRPCVYY